MLLDRSNETSRVFSANQQATSCSSLQCLVLLTLLFFVAVAVEDADVPAVVHVDTQYVSKKL